MQESLQYLGHTDLVRCISVEPNVGEYLLSGSDDGTVRLWEVRTARCLKTFNVGGVVRDVSWCPSSTVVLAAVATDHRCLIINLGMFET